MSAKKTLLVTGVVVVLLGVAGSVVFSAGMDKKNSEWAMKWKQRDEADALAKLSAEKAAREKENQFQAKNEEIEKRYAEQAKQDRKDMAAANAVADGLRRTLRDIQRGLSGSGNGKVSAIVANSATTAEAVRVLAELYEESDRNAGEIAEYADEAARAGKQCEETYDAMTGRVN